MKAAYEARYHLIEDRHWWFRSCRNYFLRLVEELAPPREAAILDLGCASGALVEALVGKGYASAAGIDISHNAVEQSGLRGLSNVRRIDAASPALASESIDLLIASDVLEHIDDDREALAQWRRLLKPGGTLAIFVPAFQFLWSAHDDLNMHRRRYTRRQLISRLRDAGFDVTFSSYWNFALFCPAAAYCLVSRLLPKRKRMPSGALRLMPLVNELLIALVRCENFALIRRIPLPIGVSVMALARPRSNGRKASETCRGLQA